MIYLSLRVRVQVQVPINCTRVQVQVPSATSLVGTANRPFASESNLESNRTLRFEFESNLRIESFQLQRILNIKISNYILSKRDVWNYIPHYNPQTH